ncbi:MAG: EF-P beta-lysylation protein EpmB [Oceanospirillum sp.]|nr:EF-P beta-lysylation protein EpmB [Oceanospirillum sp.]
MIPVSSSSVQLPTQKTSADTPWQQLFSESLLTPEQLVQRLALPETLLTEIKQANELFQLRVPEPYLDRIKKGDINDPLLKQVLPLGLEAVQTPGYVTDPLQEKDSNPIPGLVHKYKSRVLLITAGACAINCRYCFRRHFEYQDNAISSERLEQISSYLMQHPEINEVILSGGDPLATSDYRLQKIVSKLESIPHIKRLRIHTRLPVVIPQRVTEQLVSLLKGSRLKTVWVLHINHPQEIDDQVTRVSRNLKDNGMLVLNQSVILRGINDNMTILAALSEALFEADILPYYLHTFDPVTGAAHFNVSDQEAIKLWQALQAELPGFLLPKLVREIPGKPSKTLL